MAVPVEANRNPDGADNVMKYQLNFNGGLITSNQVYTVICSNCEFKTQYMYSLFRDIYGDNKVII